MRRRNRQRLTLVLLVLALVATLLASSRSRSIRESLLVDLSPLYNGHFWAESVSGNLELRIVGVGGLTRVIHGTQRFRFDRSQVGTRGAHPVGVVDFLSRGISIPYPLLSLITIAGLLIAWNERALKRRFKKWWKSLDGSPPTTRSSTPRTRSKKSPPGPKR